MSGSASRSYSLANSPELAVTLVSALATTMMLEATRVFLSYMVFMIDQSERVKLGGTAIAVFASFVLGGLIAKAIGPKAAVAATAIALLTSRLVLQFVENPDARLYLGIAAVIAWGWMLPSLRSLRPDDAARGVVYGLLLDLAIRCLFGSVDLPWIPNFSRHLVTILIAMALAFALWMMLRATTDSSIGSAGAALIGVGPGLVVYHLAIGNIGVAEIKSDLPVQLALLMTAIGIAAGFATQIRQPDPASGRPSPNGRIVAGTLTVFGVLGLLLFWRWDGIADLLAIVVSGVSAQLLVVAVRGRGEPGANTSPLRDASWLTAGMLLQVALVFIYYTDTGQPLLIGVALVLLGVGAALASPKGGSIPGLSTDRHLPAMALAAALLLFIGLGLNRSAWSTVEANGALPPEITVMTYNIQGGFSRDNVWDLEETARVIEAESPDIVILQEVSRGWLVETGVDEARWLSHRLEMNLAWGPTAKDDLWGVAILSRGEILSTDMRLYDAIGNLQRGVLGVAIKTEGAPLHVYATHLDNPTSAGATRFKQVTQLVSAMAAATPAILGGDFNATPESDVIAAILAAGFVDSGTLLPAGETTSENGRRIDYILARGTVTVIETRVIDTWASDHRPVVTRLIIA